MRADLLRRLTLPDDLSVILLLRRPARQMKGGAVRDVIDLSGTMKPRCRRAVRHAVSAHASGMVVGLSGYAAGAAANPKRRDAGDRAHSCAPAARVVPRGKARVPERASPDENSPAGIVKVAYLNVMRARSAERTGTIARRLHEWERLSCLEPQRRCYREAPRLMPFATLRLLREKRANAGAKPPTCCAQS